MLTRNHQILLDNGANISKSNALHKAASSQSPDRIPVLQLLLNQGMDVNALEHFDAEYGIAPDDRQVGTPLHYAVRQGCVSSVRFLLEHGADPNIHSSRYPRKPVDWIDERYEATSHELKALLATRDS